MKTSTRWLVIACFTALLVGLILGVAIGRSRAPFGIASPGMIEDPLPDQASTAGAPVTIEVADLKAQLEAGIPVALLDVREPDEFAAGHLAGSQSLPLGAIWARQAEVPRTAPIVVYCSSGLRSEIAARELTKLGYESIKYLKGGISAWQNAGLPITK